jgi:hypothetical protein
MANAGSIPDDAQRRKAWGFASAAVSEQVQAEAAKIVADSQGTDVSDLLNAFLTSHLPWPYRASRGRVFDSNGAVSGELGSLVYTAPTALEKVPSDTVACAIDTYGVLDIATLRNSYEKISQTKRLAKSPFPETKTKALADTTMGVIFAVDSTVPLETIGEELERLNKDRSYRYWVDAVVVLSKGTVTYAAQFPFQPLGDFLPPAQGASTLVAMYVHIFARSHSAFSLNRMCSLLFPYLHFFLPEIPLPPYQELLAGSPKTGMPIAPYQSNLKGEMMPVPLELRFDRFFAFPLSFRVETDKKELMAKVQYLPWQDGGVVRMTGKLPIEGLLVFGGKEALKQSIIRQGEEQISGVIALSKAQFMEMANRFARQSNLIVKPDERPKWVVEKGGDEGTASPFIARLHLGILHLRDQALSDPKQRDDFDKAFQGVITGLQTIRDTAKAIVTLYTTHSQRVASGAIARVSGGHLFLDENIDPELRKQTEVVISTAGRVVKDRMQEVLRVLKVDIGFFYKKPTTFATGLEKLKKTDVALADYLEKTRTNWSERLKECRDALEHRGWVLPKVRHHADSGSPCAVEPTVDGEPVTVFVDNAVDRVLCFVEEMCIHCLQARLPSGISVSEIPIAERNPAIVERFKLALVGGGMPIWAITYHHSRFEQS